MDTHKGTVLVVDDDASITTVIADRLEDEGYRVVAGLENSALRLAQEERPSVILLDVMMPAMNGIEMSLRLRSDRMTAGIPIIAMSAAPNLTAARAMQKDDCLAKPFNMEDLCAKVDLWTPPA